MKNLGVWIGVGVAVAGATAYLILRKKKTDNVLEDVTQPTQMGEAQPTINRSMGLSFKPQSGNWVRNPSTGKYEEIKPPVKVSIFDLIKPKETSYTTTEDGKVKLDFRSDFTKKKDLLTGSSTTNPFNLKLR